MEKEIQTSKTILDKQYFYITKGIKHSARFKVDEVDIITNADGELDCPLDTVLRKNGYSLNDLMSWETREICLVLVEEGIEKIVHSFPVYLSF